MKKYSNKPQCSPRKEAMFDLFKSKERREKEKTVTMIGKTLFGQIADVRNDVKSKNIDVNDFNTRLNSMYSAGYILAFVGKNLEPICDSEPEKKKFARQIFNGIFPNNGTKFIQSRVEARELGQHIAETSNSPEHTFNAKASCGEFDLGIEAAETEEAENPSKLKRYLLTGKY
jgi:hypothetical protein